MHWLINFPPIILKLSTNIESRRDCGLKSGKPKMRRTHRRRAAYVFGVQNTQMKAWSHRQWKQLDQLFRSLAKSRSVRFVSICIDIKSSIYFATFIFHFLQQCKTFWWSFFLIKSGCSSTFSKMLKNKRGSSGFYQFPSLFFFSRRSLTPIWQISILKCQ